MMKPSGIEWIGNIPDDWKTNTAFQVFTQVKNKNDGLREQNLLSLSYGRIKRKSIETVGGLLPESFDGYNIIEADDIVLRLTDLQNDQKSLRVGLSPERGIVTSAYLTLRNRSTSLPQYLYYYLHTFDISKGFYGMGAGVRQGLNWDGLKWLKILTPPAPEQERIVSFLDAECARIDAVIEQTRASIEEYKKLKQSVITQAVTKGIRPGRKMKDSGIEWVGDIPEEWVHATINKFCSLKTGGTPSTANSEWFDGDLNWFTPGDFSEQYTLSGSARKLSFKAKADGVAVIFPKDTVMIVGIGGTAGKIGFTTCECSCNQQVTAIITNQKIKSRFLMYWMIANTKRLKDTALYTTLPIINNQTIGEYPVLVPNDIDEQNEIICFLDEKTKEIEKLIEKKHELILTLEAYKKSLIFEYVTGKKEVPV